MVIGSPSDLELLVDPRASIYAKEYKIRRLNPLFKKNYKHLSNEDGEDALDKAVEFIMYEKPTTSNPVFLKRVTKIARLGLQANLFNMPKEYTSLSDQLRFFNQKIEFLEKLYQFNQAGTNIDYSEHRELKQVRIKRLESHFYGQAGLTAKLLYEINNEQSWGDTAIKDKNKAAQISLEINDHEYALGCYQDIINLANIMVLNSSNPVKYLTQEYRAVINTVKIIEKIDNDQERFIGLNNKAASIAKEIYKQSNNSTWLKKARRAYAKITDVNPEKLTRKSQIIHKKSFDQINYINSVIKRSKR